MVRKGRMSTKSRGMGGISKATGSSKSRGKTQYTMVPIYTPDDLPDSVKAVLKVLYPQSKGV